MDVLKFGVVRGDIVGKLSIDGFIFVNGDDSMVNDPIYVIPAIIRSLASHCPGCELDSSLSIESEMIVLKAIQKARHSK